ncbi:Integrin beta-like protein 1 [Intoshia linei]|uniref:Integrin beta-like protein 1 n=1 Tax=Intoshia linei TaxID=1819745 RepID=A0A177B9L7_9BILA|nr:Integrin beta-like protein 1 [Intoshia linei]
MITENDEYLVQNCHVIKNMKKKKYTNFKVPLKYHTVNFNSNLINFDLSNRYRSKFEKTNRNKKKSSFVSREFKKKSFKFSKNNLTKCFKFQPDFKLTHENQFRIYKRDSDPNFYENTSVKRNLNCSDNCYSENVYDMAMPSMKGISNTLPKRIYYSNDRNNPSMGMIKLNNEKGSLNVVKHVGGNDLKNINRYENLPFKKYENIQNIKALRQNSRESIKLPNKKLFMSTIIFSLAMILIFTFICLFVASFMQSRGNSIQNNLLSTTPSIINYNNAKNVTQDYSITGFIEMWSSVLYILKCKKLIKVQVEAPFNNLLIYGKLNSIPTIYDYDFIKYARPNINLNNVNYQNVDPDLYTNDSHVLDIYHEKNAFFLSDNIWYLRIYNDFSTKAKYQFTVEGVNGKLDKDNLRDCPYYCSGNGACINGQCQCYKRFTGWDCSESICLVLCSNHGDYEKGTCHCHNGWHGEECQLKFNCNISPCLNDGICIIHKCLCKDGFNGIYCQKQICNTLKCLHGICHNSVCYCDANYYGNNCNNSIENLPKAKQMKQHPIIIKDSCENTCINGQCVQSTCRCNKGWTGKICNVVSCNIRCKGLCVNGQCICEKGKNGEFCSLEGCTNNCNNHGTCKIYGNVWQCTCYSGWSMSDCSVQTELICDDSLDNDHDGLIDCYDSDCCISAHCNINSNCEILPSPTSLISKNSMHSQSFYEKHKKFLLNGLQLYTLIKFFQNRRILIISGKIVQQDQTAIIGARVYVKNLTNLGFTLSRENGKFDLMIPFYRNYISLFIQKNYFVDATFNLHLPYFDNVYGLEANIVLNSLKQNYNAFKDNDYSFCGNINEFDVPQIELKYKEIDDVLNIPLIKTNLLLQYSQSLTCNLPLLIIIHILPNKIPIHLKHVEISISISGNVYKRILEAKESLNFRVMWNRKNIYGEKVYGGILSHVVIGYLFENCTKKLVYKQLYTLPACTLPHTYLSGMSLNYIYKYDFNYGYLYGANGIRTKNLILFYNLLYFDSDTFAIYPFSFNENPTNIYFVLKMTGILKFEHYVEFKSKLVYVKNLIHEYFFKFNEIDQKFYVSGDGLYSLPKYDMEKSKFHWTVISNKKCKFIGSSLCGNNEHVGNSSFYFIKDFDFDKHGNVYLIDGPVVRRIGNTNKIITQITNYSFHYMYTKICPYKYIPFDKVYLENPQKIMYNGFLNLFYILDNHLLFVLDINNNLGYYVNGEYSKECFLDQPHHFYSSKFLKNIIDFCVYYDSTLYYLTSENEIFNCIDNNNVCINETEKFIKFCSIKNEIIKKISCNNPKRELYIFIKSNLSKTSTKLCTLNPQILNSNLKLFKTSSQIIPNNTRNLNFKFPNQVIELDNLNRLKSIGYINYSKNSKYKFINATYINNENLNVNNILQIPSLKSLGNIMTSESKNVSNLNSTQIISTVLKFFDTVKQRLLIKAEIIEMYPHYLDIYGLQKTNIKSDMYIIKVLKTHFIFSSESDVDSTQKYTSTMINKLIDSKGNYFESKIMYQIENERFGYSNVFNANLQNVKFKYGFLETIYLINSLNYPVLKHQLKSEVIYQENYIKKYCKHEFNSSGHLMKLQFPNSSILIKYDYTSINFMPTKIDYIYSNTKKTYIIKYDVNFDIYQIKTPMQRCLKYKVNNLLNNIITIDYSLGKCNENSRNDDNKSKNDNINYISKQLFHKKKKYSNIIFDIIKFNNFYIEKLNYTNKKWVCTCRNSFKVSKENVMKNMNHIVTVFLKLEKTMKKEPFLFPINASNFQQKLNYENLSIEIFIYPEFKNNKTSIIPTKKIWLSIMENYTSIHVNLKNIKSNLIVMKHDYVLVRKMSQNINIRVKKLNLVNLISFDSIENCFKIRYKKFTNFRLNDFCYFLEINLKYCIKYYFENGVMINLIDEKVLHQKSIQRNYKLEYDDDSNLKYLFIQSKRYKTWNYHPSGKLNYIHVNNGTVYIYYNKLGQISNYSNKKFIYDKLSRLVSIIYDNGNKIGMYYLLIQSTNGSKDFRGYKNGFFQQEITSYLSHKVTSPNNKYITITINLDFYYDGMNRLQTTIELEKGYIKKVYYFYFHSNNDILCTNILIEQFNQKLIFITFEYDKNVITFTKKILKPGNHNLTLHGVYNEQYKILLDTCASPFAVYKKTGECTWKKHIKINFNPIGEIDSICKFSNGNECDIIKNGANILEEFYIGYCGHLQNYKHSVSINFLKQVEIPIIYDTFIGKFLNGGHINLLQNLGKFVYNPANIASNDFMMLLNVHKYDTSSETNDEAQLINDRFLHYDQVFPSSFNTVNSVYIPFYIDKDKNFGIDPLIVTYKHAMNKNKIFKALIKKFNILLVQIKYAFDSINPQMSLIRKITNETTCSTGFENFGKKEYCYTFYSKLSYNRLNLFTTTKTIKSFLIKAKMNLKIDISKINTHRPKINYIILHLHENQRYNITIFYFNTVMNDKTFTAFLEQKL